MKVDCVHKAFRMVSGTKNILKLLSLVFIIIQRMSLGKINAREGVGN